MTKINLDELLADREAGTDGPWEYRTGPALNGRYHTVYVQNEDDPMVCECWEGEGGFQENCARRIARLPDLEAAYIEAVERQERQYYIGPLTFDRVFRAGQLENLHDMQAVLDAVERALEAE